jgi:hypothetical protein
LNQGDGGKKGGKNNQAAQAVDQSKFGLGFGGARLQFLTAAGLL